MNKKKKYIILISVAAIVYFALLGYFIYDQVVQVPIKKEVYITVKKMVDLDYGNTDVLDQKYQNKNVKVPAEVVQQKKDEIKSEMESVYGSDYYLFNTYIESSYDTVDAQAEKTIIFPKEQKCDIDWIFFLNVNDKEARVILYAYISGDTIEIQNGIEQYYDPEPALVKYEVGLVNVDGNWLVKDAELTPFDV